MGEVLANVMETIDNFHVSEIGRLLTIKDEEEEDG